MAQVQLSSPDPTVHAHCWEGLASEPIQDGNSVPGIASPHPGALCQWAFPQAAPLWPDGNLQEGCPCVFQWCAPLTFQRASLWSSHPLANCAPSLCHTVLLCASAPWGRSSWRLGLDRIPLPGAEQELGKGPVWESDGPTPPAIPPKLSTHPSPWC